MQSDSTASHHKSLGKLSNNSHFLAILSIFIAILTGCASGSSSGSSSGGGSSKTQTTAPVLSGLAPPAATAGVASLTLSANGSNFVSGSQIEWNGSPLTTTYVSPFLLTAQVPASDLATSTTSQVTVFTPGASGGTSSPQSFPVNYPQPSLTSISSNSATVGSAAITLTAIGFGYVPGSQIEWNATALATTYISGTQLTAQIPASDLTAPASVLISVLNPTPGGGQSTGQFFTVNPGTTQLKVIASPANDIAWDSSRGIFYASQTGANGTGGSIMTVNPLDGSVGTPQSAGNSPNLLALSSDASYLWVAENGDNAVQRFLLPNLTPDVKFTLSASSTTSAQALGLRSAPNSPTSVAVLSGNPNYPGYPGNSLVIYNDATPQQVTFGSNLISFDWGANVSTLDASQGTYASTSLITANVTSSGVSSTNNYPYDFPAAYPATQKIHFDQLTGYLYSDGGQVVNPATGDVIGSFNLSGFLSESMPTLCVVDSSIVFFLGQIENQYPVNGYTIQAFDKTTYRLLGSLNIPQSAGPPVDFVRWGNAGLAFNVVPSSFINLPSAIYLVDGSFVNSSQPADFSNGSGLSLFPNVTTMSPQMASVGAADTTITVFGTNFLPGATAFWTTPASPKPQSLNTVYVSSGQLQATIPASLLTASGGHGITVSNSLSASGSQNALTFTVSSSPFTVMNLNALDLAWDQNSSLLYASVWSIDAQYPNSIVAINPNTAQVVKSQFTGPDPYLVRPSADGKYLYTAFMAKNAVTQLQLPALNSPLSWSLGAHTKAGPFLAIDLQPAPGASQTTAITVGASTVVNDLNFPLGDDTIGSLTIFDNNVPRPVNLKANGTSTYDLLVYGDLQWGANNSTLYSEDSFSSTDLNNLAVNSSGVSLLQAYPNAVNDRSSLANPDPLSGSGGKIHFDAGTGYIFDDEGDAIDPATGKLINSYYASGLVVPDSTTNSVYILGQTQAQRAASQFGVYGYTIESFDQKLYTPLSSITLSSIQGTPLEMVRWGSSGLAFVTFSSRNDIGGSPGMLYIVNLSNFTTPSQTSTQSAHSIEPVYRTWTKPHIAVPNSPLPKNQPTPPLIPLR